jgi:acetyl-CoA acetyltransferase
MTMGITAENVAELYGVSRQEMDQMAVRSHRKASQAWAEGRFDKQIIPIEIQDDEGNTVIFKKDEGFREEVTVEDLAKLKTVFKENGVVTAGHPHR